MYISHKMKKKNLHREKSILDHPVFNSQAASLKLRPGTTARIQFQVKSLDQDKTTGISFINQVAKAKDYPVDLYFLMDLSWWNISKFICECVRSIINFHPRNQDVDFNMLEMFFSFQCAKYDEKRWLNTKLFKKKRRNSPKKTICLFCTIVTHSVLLCYTAIGHLRWVRWDPKWPWAPWQWVGMTF